jgi:peptidoglycan biosynthesis protein MviN/MurJ (putative lipid II flippase)
LGISRQPHRFVLVSFSRLICALWEGTAFLGLGILAAVLGVAAGLVGFAPYLLIYRRIKAKVENQGVRSIQLGCLGAILSSIIMAALLVAVRFLMAEQFLVFALGGIGTFLVCMFIGTVSLARGQRGSR